MRLSPELLAVDLYQLLGVPEDASPARIRQAYRRAAMHSHPDLVRDGRSGAEQEMARINVAAGVLLDPQLRAAYDARRLRPRGATATRHKSDPSVDWVKPARRSRIRLTRELAQMVARVHPWPARQLSALDARLQSWPRERHVMFITLAMAAALLLIACSRPASLGFWCNDDCPPQPVSGRHL